MRAVQEQQLRPGFLGYHLGDFGREQFFIKNILNTVVFRLFYYFDQVFRGRLGLRRKTLVSREVGQPITPIEVIKSGVPAENIFFQPGN